MRRLLTNFKNPSKSQLGVPSLPTGLSFSELNYLTKRGFLAKKLSQYLGLNKEEGDSLFYYSLSTDSVFDTKQKNQMAFLLHVSDLMLEWSNQGQDLPKKIKDLNVKNDIQNAMLKAHAMFKQELFTSCDQVIQTEQDVSLEQTVDSNWKVYRDVIFAATQEKFLLILEDEVNIYKKGKIFCEGTIKNRTDIPICRNYAKECLELQGFHKSKIMSWLLILSEAITNTIKHAEEGKMILIEDEGNNEVRFIIEDKGPGFSLEDLPKTTLLAGYSTKKSMGQGFTLMMKMAKQVLLRTSSNGSTLILKFDSNKEEKGREMNAIS